jgi:thiol-disulfide isomerase/thioredoxin
MKYFVKDRKFNISHFVLLLGIAISMIFGCGEVQKHTGSEFTPQPIILEDQEVRLLEIGESAPSFELPDMYGYFVSIDDFSVADILVVVFLTNHCPTAQAYEDRLIAFTGDYEDKNVAVVAINPTSPFALLPEECGYSDLDDTFENMSVRAETKGYNFPYLYDGDDQAVSIQFGPQATPHVFVFDSERKLRYTGRLDGVERPGTANAEDLRLAVDQILAGEEVSNPQTKSFGCSIKWSWISDWAERVNREWKNRPVTLMQIDEAGIATLIANNSEKLRLINVWASWCAPCIIELPDLVLLQRYYGGRAFEFITISADQIDKFDSALRILSDKHLPVQNFIFHPDDSYKLIEAVDPAWSGALPYTMLIEPSGEIVYRTEGIVDLLELKRVIVEHPLMGRYY